MIFYFSGTGNSWSVAKKISENLNEEYISIAECVSKKMFEFECTENENIGFVYPIYGFRPPKIVLDFIDNLKIKNSYNKYVYCIDTGAGSPGYSEKVISKCLKNNNFDMKGSFEIFMPGNYIVSKRSLPSEEVKRRLANEENEVLKIVQSIKNKDETYVLSGFNTILWIESYIIGKYLFPLSIKSTKFFVTSKCVNCNSCINSCPVHALTRENNKIVRNNEKCILCMKCINCCPKGAIEFGKATIGKKRYKHPDYKLQ